MSTKPYICDEKDAEKIHHWLLHRGGIYIWRSVNLSNPGASWTSPALSMQGEPTTKPTWQADNKPERHIVNIADVRVSTAKEVKRFHVATRMGDSGLSIKLTDASSRRLRTEVDKASEKYGRSAWYEFDYCDYRNGVVMISDKIVTMAKWAAKHNQEAACPANS